MPFVFKRLALLASIVALVGANKAQPAEKEHAKFAMGPAEGFPSHQTSQKVTIGAAPYDTADTALTAFGKLNPYQHGILPVLVVIQNSTGQAIRVGRIRGDFIAPDGSPIEATTPPDGRDSKGTNQPKRTTV